jgi:hypothetical protein
MRPAIDPKAQSSPKFVECLPPALVTEMLIQSLCDLEAWKNLLAQPVRIFVS